LKNGTGHRDTSEFDALSTVGNNVDELWNVVTGYANYGPVAGLDWVLMETETEYATLVDFYGFRDASARVIFVDKASKIITKKISMQDFIKEYNNNEIPGHWLYFAPPDEFFDDCKERHRFGV
jgi:hypothetical protein